MTSRSPIEEYAFQSAKTTDQFRDFLKTVMTLTTGLIGILVALKPSVEMAEQEAKLFVFTISLMALTTLLGVVLLYGDYHRERRQRNKLDNRIKDETMAPRNTYSGPRSQTIVETKSHLLMPVIEILFLLVLATSFIFLVLYGAHSVLK